MPTIHIAIDLPSIADPGVLCGVRIQTMAKMRKATPRTPETIANTRAIVSGIIVFLPNVRDDRSPLAFGVTPARQAESAGGMTKVPKAW